MTEIFYQEVTTMLMIFRILMGGIVPLLLIGIGILFVYLSHKISHDQSKLEKVCTASVTGTIIRLTPEECNVSTDIQTKQYLYIPVVKYDVHGFIYEKSLNGHNYNYFSIGEKVTVNYNPSNPEQFYVKKDTAPKTIQRYYLPVGIFLLFLAFLEGILSNILIFLI